MQVEFYPDKKYFIIDGKKYKEKTQKYKKIDGIIHIEKVIFEEVDDKKEEEEEERIDFLKGKLKGGISKERVIEEVLNGLSTLQLKRMEKLIKEKNAKITRQDGCLGIKIDAGKHNNMYLQIYE